LGIYNTPAEKVFARILPLIEGRVTGYSPEKGIARHIEVGQSNIRDLRLMVDPQRMAAYDQEHKKLHRERKNSGPTSNVKQARNTGESGLLQTWTSVDGEAFELCAEGTMRFNPIQSLSKVEKQQRMDSMPGSRNYDAKFAHGNVIGSLRTYDPISGWSVKFPKAKALVEMIMAESDEHKRKLLKDVFIQTLNGGSWNYGGSVWNVMFRFCEHEYEATTELRAMLQQDPIWSSWREEVGDYEASNGKGSVGRLARSTTTAYIDHVIANATKLGFNVWSHEHDGVFCDVPPTLMEQLQASANSAFHVTLNLREKAFAPIQ